MCSGIHFLADFLTSLLDFIVPICEISTENIVLNTPSNRLTSPFPKDSKPPIISPDKKFVTPEKTSASELTSPATYQEPDRVSVVAHPQAMILQA